VNEKLFLCVFMSYMFYIARSMPNTIKVNKQYTHKCMFMFLVLVLFASELDFVTQRMRLQSPLLGINLGTWPKPPSQWTKFYQQNNSFHGYKLFGTFKRRCEESIHSKDVCCVHSYYTLGEMMQLHETILPTFEQFY